MVIGTEGTTRVFLSYKGMPVLVSPEQCLAPNNDEVKLFELMVFDANHNDLLNHVKQYNTQNSFIGECGPSQDIHGLGRDPAFAEARVCTT